jgi:hypothetical protein
MSETMTSDSWIFLCTTISSTSPFLAGDQWVLHCGAEISNSFICNKFSSFAPKELKNMLFQNGYLAFSSHASSDLCLKLKSSMMSASFHIWPDDLYTAASSTSVLPIRIHTPCGFYWNKGRQIYVGVGNAFLTATAVLPFLLGNRSVL